MHSGELINTKFGHFVKLKMLLPLERLYGNGVFGFKLRGVNLESLKTCQNLISALRGIFLMSNLAFLPSQLTALR